MITSVLTLFVVLLKTFVVYLQRNSYALISYHNNVGVLYSEGAGSDTGFDNAVKSNLISTVLMNLDYQCYFDITRCKMILNEIKLLNIMTKF